MSLRALRALTRTMRLGGLALMVIGSPVNGFRPGLGGLVLKGDLHEARWYGRPTSSSPMMTGSKGVLIWAP
jgi:hypothetical protein